LIGGWPEFCRVPTTTHQYYEHAGKTTFGRFWVSMEDQSDENEEEEITTPTIEEFISVAARIGIQIKVLISTENKIETMAKVNFSSPSSSEFRCPLSSKIIVGSHKMHIFTTNILTFH
jgi:hypothetical protein